VKGHEDQPGGFSALIRRKCAAYAAAALLILCLAASGGLAGDYRVRKSASGFTFDVTINRNPPVLGDNELRIEIRDAGGAPVRAAELLVNYYMPPMPGMPPMNYTIPAQSSGQGYRAVLDLIMTGPWNIVLRMKHEGNPVRISFPIDVR
jgi:hypothetical protein